VAYVVGESGVETWVDFGAVGDVREVNTDLIGLLVGAGYVPVVASLCADAEGNILNVNADTMAQELAVALGVERLVVLTNVPGIMRDPWDPSSRVEVCSLAEVRGMMADGTISGGMLPKVENCIRAIEAGVGAVQIVDGMARPSLLRGAVRGESVGTVVRRDD
jgi:acetylglutamate kinase